jgi:hypothetical protein
MLEHDVDTEEPKFDVALAKALGYGEEDFVFEQGTFGNGTCVRRSHHDSNDIYNWHADSWIYGPVLLPYDHEQSEFYRVKSQGSHRSDFELQFANRRTVTTAPKHIGKASGVAQDRCGILGACTAAVS